MVIDGDQVRLRTVTTDDLPRVLEILTAPNVAEWWGGYTAERLAKELEDTTTRYFVVEADGETVGYIQGWEEAEPDYRHAGIDIAIAPSAQGRGFGTDAVRTLARYLVHELGHHRVTIDPSATNARAIRSYEKVGFKAVGVLRRYWLGPDGDWHDGLLMDLLADELE